MHRLLIIAAVALSLASCGTGGGIGLTPLMVSQAIAAACGLVPDIATIANLVAAGNATFTSAATIAEAVCTAYANTPHSFSRRRLSAPIAVNIGGIVVRITGI